MVALSALRAYNEPSFEIVAKGAAHHAQVLVEDEPIGRGHAHHLVRLLVQQLLAIFGRITLRTL